MNTLHKRQTVRGEDLTVHPSFKSSVYKFEGYLSVKSSGLINTTGQSLIVNNDNLVVCCSYSLFGRHDSQGVMKSFSFSNNT